MRLYRAEGAHDQPGYAGRVDARTGRYFGSRDRALTYCTEGRHLFEVTLTGDETLHLYGNPADHVLVTSEQAARKTHSPDCPCHEAVESLMWVLSVDGMRTILYDLGKPLGGRKRDLAARLVDAGVTPTNFVGYLR